MPPACDSEVSPEKLLLVSCARTRLTPETRERIRALLREPLDWQYLLDAATEHSLRPLLLRYIVAVSPNVAPAEWLANLQESVRANSIRNLFFTAELCKILDRFSECGISAIPYKGPVLAAQAYGDVALREFDDLDVIVSQRDIHAAHQAITSLGYAAKFPWIHSPEIRESFVPGEYSYVDCGRRVAVELHTEYTLRHFPKPPDLDSLRRRLTPVSLGGSRVQTFQPEDLLPILCVHGSKDFWARISWIADISELVQTSEGFDWQAAMDRAASLGVERMTHLGMVLALDLLNLSVPEEVLRQVNADRSANHLAQQLKHRILAPGLLPLSAPWRFLYRIRTADGYSRGLPYAVRLLFAPAEDDREAIRLPGVLRRFYPALRPFRLLRKYGAGGTASRKPVS
ncbi:MAG: nucleotidyltransferase family protein [Candidatus Acidiferrales bacterium]